MKTQVTHGIILSRINYGESDRIITVLSLDHGKLRLIAKGSRKVKSKLAGGIELFSTFEASFIEGRGEIGTLASARLEKFYSNIIKDINRVQMGYEILKTIDKLTEDNAEAEYYNFLKELLAKLNDLKIDADLVKLWFEAQLLNLFGHQPNLNSDSNGNVLDASKKYSFDIDRMCFSLNNSGSYNQHHIKYLRLLFDRHKSVVFNLNDIESIKNEVQPLMETMFRSYLPI